MGNISSYPLKRPLHIKLLTLILHLASSRPATFQTILCNPQIWSSMIIPLDQRFMKYSDKHVWHQQPCRIQSHSKHFSSIFWCILWTSAACLGHCGVTGWIDVCINKQQKINISAVSIPKSHSPSTCSMCKQSTGNIIEFYGSWLCWGICGKTHESCLVAFKTRSSSLPLSHCHYSLKKNQT